MNNTETGKQNVRDYHFIAMCETFKQAFNLFQAPAQYSAIHENAVKHRLLHCAIVEKMYILLK